MEKQCQEVRKEQQQWEQCPGEAGGTTEIRAANGVECKCLSLQMTVLAMRRSVFFRVVKLRTAVMWRDQRALSCKEREVRADKSGDELKGPVWTDSCKSCVRASKH